MPKGTPRARGLDVLAEALRAEGFNREKARRAAAAIRDIWKAALLRGETVEMPGMVIKVVKWPRRKKKLVINHALEGKKGVRIYKFPDKIVASHPTFTLVKGPDGQEHMENIAVYRSHRFRGGSD